MKCDISRPDPTTPSYKLDYYWWRCDPSVSQDIAKNLW